MAYLNQKTRIIAVGGKQVNADWNETNPLSPAYIQNKPDISGALTRQVVEQLPTEDIDPNCIYMVPNDDHYDEFMYINGSWEQIGSTEVQQVQSDWDETDPTSPAYIDNKPTLATVATSGSYTDLSNTPTLATVATSGSYTDLSNTPSLATVATTGSYTDLSNTPTIPTVNDATITIQQDGTTVGTFTTNDSTNQTINLTGGSSENNWYGTQGEFDMLYEFDENTNYYIEGELKRVALTGDFNDLSNRPTAAVAFSGEYKDVKHAPTPTQNVVLGRKEVDWYGTQAEFDALEQAGQLEFYKNYYIEGEGGGTQVQSDWNETDTTDPAYILNKPTIGTGVTSLYYGSTDNLIGSWNANQTSTGGQVIKPQSVTISTTTVTTDVKGGRVYDCTVDVTALNLTAVEDNPCETDIYFHTSSNGCTFTYPNTLDNIIGSTTLTADKDYRIRVKDNVMEIINLEYTMPTNIVTGYNGNSYVVRYISQTDYDNLGTYDANTIYLIY